MANGVVYSLLMFSFVAMLMPNIATLERRRENYTLSLRGGMAKSKASNVQGKEKAAEAPSLKSVEM